MMRATVLMPALGTCISWQARIEVATTRSFDQLVIFLGVIYWRLLAANTTCLFGDFILEGKIDLLLS
jgi:hypothetical protein